MDGSWRSDVTEVVMWGVIVLAAVMVLRAIVNNRFSNQNNNAAVLTAFHDFQSLCEKHRNL
jgi:hypothetical protein